MDLKTFSGTDFDSKKWINNAWTSSSNQEKEVIVSNTVSRLQLYMKQLTNSLDETTTQIVTSIPRILQDASSLQMEGAVLQQKLISLEQKVEGVEQQTGHSIESLQRIDQLKSRLEMAASALREADKWAALASSLEEILESGVPTQTDKLAQLSDLVSAMTASLEVLSDAPDYENKRQQLEKLYNRLEAAITPKLLEALTQMDADRTSTYVSLFRGMSRDLSVCRCWRRAAAVRLANSWRRMENHSLRVLTRLLAGDAGKQVDWLTNVLKTDAPVAELIRLYTDLLLSLDPSPTKVVTANLKLCSTPDEGITLILDLRRDIDDLTDCIKGIMDTPRQNKECISPATIKEFGVAAHASLRELLPRYTELQTQLLLAHVDVNKFQQEDLVEHSRALNSIAERCEAWLSSAKSTAEKIAGDAAYPFYAPVVDDFIATILSHISAHSRRIETAFLSSITAGESAGVLSSTFPATLVLRNAAGKLLEIALRQNVLVDEPKDRHPLNDLPALLLDKDTIQKLPAMRAEPQACAAGLGRVRDQLKGLSRTILRQPVDAQLDKIPTLNVWSNNDALTTDLPDYALSPQEYITEIGQYLMTLPQHLEMHMTEKHAPWRILTVVCTYTCDVYAQKILNIRNMDALGTKRCLTDIVYLSSVVEDLGTKITPELRNLEKSLRAAAPSSE